ncbi:FKBP-type peptidyl-prolyl cis-trans isomerase [Balneola vulgaris]|uniref:FKBP-type peptidyl-prolyl cis-trans isomerase n=1 Tax=Balneola vulgaris TaxID=287535 RepID=UPI00036E415E|nr:FKBP-type peptidyl-prolyl cis-trans isomerase [Balneola vulgaris]
MKNLFLLTLAATSLLFTGCLRNSGCDVDVNTNVDQAQLESDIAAIDAYIEENQIQNVQTDPTGIRYVITTEGSGTAPDLCSTVGVNYVGKLMSNGNIFDESDRTVAFPLSNLIAGWQIGIPKIKSGGSITLYIPSGYAYGPRQVGSIPANSNLIFEIDLIGVQ